MSTHPTSARIPRAELYLLSITLIWGSTFAVSKIVLASISPYLLQAVRFALAALIVGIYTRREIRATTRASLKAGIVLGLLLGIGFLLQTVGLTLTSASRTGFLTGTMVVFTPLLQLALERRAPTAGNVAGVLLVMIGLAMMTSPGGGAFGLGDLLVLACAVVFAASVVYLDIATREAFRGEIVFYQFVVTSLVALVALPFAGDAGRWTPEAAGGTIYLAVFASAIAIFVQSKYQRESTPTRAAVIYSFEPVIAAAVAWLLIGERLEGWGLAGAAVIFAGLLASELWPSGHAPHQRH